MVERTGSSLEFGIRMRGMREAAKLTAREVAALLNCSESLVYSAEGGYRTISPMSLSGLLTGPYQRPDLVPYMTALLNEVIEGVDRPIRDEPTTAPNVMLVHQLEARATAAFGMIIDQIPKLCQLPEYMRAQHRMAGLDEEQINGLTEAGIQRQNRFFAMSKPPHTSIIMTEGALDRGQQVSGQMRHLFECAQRDALSIYLLTNANGPQPVFCSFTVMDFDEFPGILWADSAIGGTLSTKIEEVSEARDLWGKLALVAANPTETLDLVRERC